MTQESGDSMVPQNYRQGDICWRDTQQPTAENRINVNAGEVTGAIPLPRTDLDWF